MNMQFSAITMCMHFSTFKLRICAYSGVRSNTIDIDFILGIKGTLIWDLLRSC